MVQFMLMDLLIASLLFAGALLIILWKKDLRKPSHKLVKHIGLGIGVMSFKWVIDLVYQLITSSESGSIYGLIPEILGVLLIVFSFFNYLEART